MTDTDQDRNETVYADRPLSEAQQEARQRFDMVPVRTSGAIAPQTFAQAIDYAKMMSTAVGAVGNHMMKNPGACLAIMEIASQFGMPAYSVARQTYLVNGRIAFMGQFFHTVVEQHAPLKKGPNGRKLQWRYEGQGDTLKIIVSATFEGASEPVEYESPMFKDIKVKNSPLWYSEPKRQFIYFGVRGWQTINWPEGLLSAISEDEAAALPELKDVTPVTDAGKDIRARLQAHHTENPDAKNEGFKPGFTEAHFTEETEQVDKTTGEITTQPAEPEKPRKSRAKAKEPETVGQILEQNSSKPGDDPPLTEDELTGAGSGPDDDAAERQAKLNSLATPTNSAEWQEYARTWISLITDAEALKARWAAELKLRNQCGVTEDDRLPLMQAFHDRLKVLMG